MNIRMKATLASALVAGLLAGAANADIAINSVSDSYSQSFNSLPIQNSGTSTWTDNSTLGGWYRRANVSNADQTQDPELVNYAVQGSNVGPAGFYNVSTANNSDRAIGFRVDGQPGGLKKGSVGVIFENNSGTTLTGFDVAYRGEQWYRSGNATTLLFQWRVVDSFADISNDIDIALAGWNDAGALSWAVAAGGSATWINGTTAGNYTNIIGSVTGMSLGDGQKLILRWRIAETGESKAGLMIDDVTVNNFQAIPEPATLGLIVSFGAGVVAIRRIFAL